MISVTPRDTHRFCEQKDFNYLKNWIFKDVEADRTQLDAAFSLF